VDPSLRPASPRRDRAPSAILVAGVAGQLLAYLSAWRSVDLDAFHEMSLFRVALASGALPKIDPFAYTPTLRPFIHHEWGTGAVLYGVWEGLGWGPAGLGVLRYLLVALAGALAWWTVRRKGASCATIAVTSPLAAFLVVVGFASPVRAQAFTIVLTAALLGLLELDREGRRGWIVPWLALHVAWLNLHGGFVVGFAVVGGTVLERLVVARWNGARARDALASVTRLIGVGAAMAVLVLANPYGWDYVPYLGRALTMPRTAIGEWAPLWDPRYRPLFVVHALSIALFAYTIAVGRRRVLSEIGGWGLVAITSVAALTSQRHLSIHAVAWFTFVAPGLARTELGRVVERAWARAPLAFAAASLVFAAAGAWKTVERRAWRVEITQDARVDGRRYPVDAVDFLASRGFRGRLLTHFNDGSYVSWRLYPAVQVSLDSRYEAVFSQGVFDDHQTLFAARPGWRSVLDRHPPDAILIPRPSSLEPLLAVAPAAWVCVYEDPEYAIFARAPAPAVLRASDGLTRPRAPRRRRRAAARRAHPVR
jgi:hypothetical protein